MSHIHNKNLRVVALAGIFVAIAAAQPVHAQTPGSSTDYKLPTLTPETIIPNLPTPLLDLFHLGQNINTGIRESSLFQNIKDAGVKHQIVTGQLPSILGNAISQAKDWLQSTLGVPFKEILRVIINVALWVFDFFSNILRLLLEQV